MTDKQDLFIISRQDAVQVLTLLQDFEVPSKILKKCIIIMSTLQQAKITEENNEQK